MNVTENQKSETRTHIAVSFSAEEIAATEAAIIAEYGREARFPGFRPGKVPAQRVRARFSREIAEELKRKCASDAVNKAVNECKRTIENVVDIEANVTAGQPCEIIVIVDLVPEFELPEYKGIPVKSQNQIATDVDIDNEIEHHREVNRDFIEVERAVQKGDYVRVTYRGRIGDQLLVDVDEIRSNPIWGTQENTWEEAGAEGERRHGVPAVIDGLIGMAIGEHREVTMVFPDDHEIEFLRGKTATYSIEVIEVREPRSPELDETFFKKFDVETLEELREVMRRRIETRMEQENAAQTRVAILDHLCGAVAFEIPESVVEEETRVAMTRVMQAGMARGISMEQFEAEKDAFYARARKTAEKQVRGDYILKRIAQKEEIKPSTEEISRAIVTQAYQMRIPPEKHMKEISEDKTRLRGLYQAVALNKTLDFLVNEARVEEVTAS